jgi:hypothetical protein
MAKDRQCLACPNLPIIKGKSWGSHCRNRHKNRKDVAYNYIKAAEEKLDALICEDSGK